MSGILLDLVFSDAMNVSIAGSGVSAVFESLCDFGLAYCSIVMSIQAFPL